ncbi:MAG: hypothetical protein JW841_02145 [Deltaproteobacteria bacterium]|nr:hypothetical protein [Deltaproteobacteria bacterium]
MTLLLSIFINTNAFARVPSLAIDSREGVWMGVGHTFIQQSRDRWNVYAASAPVNALTVDDLTLWVATDDGVVRFETASRRQTMLTMDDGLPSQAITSVAVDRNFVWFATNRGLVRYRKLDRTIRVFDDENGLPHRAVNAILEVGNVVWIATRAGLAAYDAATESIRSYTANDGLASDYIEELYAFRDEIWCRTDVGLSRFRPDTKRFTNFSFADLGGEQIRAVVADGDKLWIGTEKGLTSYDSASEALVAFTQQSSLENNSIIGLEPFTDYLFIITEAEVVQYHKNNRSFRRFTDTDGLKRRTGAIGTVLASGQLIVMFQDGAEVLDIQRDLWMHRTLEVTKTAGETSAISWQIWSTLDAQQPRDLDTGKKGTGGYANLSGGAGLGVDVGEGRSFDASAILDYGELELKGIRDVEGKVEYRGRDSDVVREVELNDKYNYRSLEEGIVGPLLVSGAHTRVATPGSDPTFSFAVDGGVRRGVSARDFIINQPRQEIYALKHQYILPNSEKVYLDGELLTSGTDYTVLYTAGKIAFLDPERVDDLSVIEIAYEYDVIPKKGLGVISLLDMLPDNNEIGSWAQAAQPTVVSQESGLYLQIDGAAPKYIDRGWVRSVFAEYQQGSLTMRVWVHDMGSKENAQKIYDDDRPASLETFAGKNNIVLDIGLATSYAIKAYVDSFYIELSIDDKSETGKSSINIFGLELLERGENAGEYQFEARRESIVAARAAFSPLSGLEFGGRAIQVESLPKETSEIPKRRLITGIVDTRFERASEQGARFTAYAEGAASHDMRHNKKDGFTGLGQLRIAHPFIEGSVSGQHTDNYYIPIGSMQSAYGLLRDEVRADTTLYPTRWLPTSLFFVRQTSRNDEEDATRNGGLSQHTIMRMQLTHPSVPALDMQVGHSLLDAKNGAETNRLKAIGQGEYDLAEGILKPLGFKKLYIKGLYSISEAETENAPTINDNGNDRVVIGRIETKFSPTATESAYAIWRSRNVGASSPENSKLATTNHHWELNAGARSAIIPGLVPQVNESVIYDDDRLADEGPTRRANSSLSGQLGIYPGEWIAALTPVVMDAKYSYNTENVVVSGLRETDTRAHRADNRISYNGMGMWEMLLQQVYETSFLGQTQKRQDETLEIRNRFVFKPVHTSPITVRFDYVRERTRNDLTVLASAPLWGVRDLYDSLLSWQMRWTDSFTTKLETAYTLDHTRRKLQEASTGTPAVLQNFRQHQVTPGIELRYQLQTDENSLFVVQRNQIGRIFGSAEAQKAITGNFSLGIIWTYADNIYFDGEVAYTQTWCDTDSCSTQRLLTPRLLFTAKM